MQIAKVLLINIGSDLKGELVTELQKLKIYFAEHNYSPSNVNPVRKSDYDIVIVDCQNHRSINSVHPLGSLALVHDIKQFGKYAIILSSKNQLNAVYEAASKYYATGKLFRKAPEYRFEIRDVKTIIETINKLKKMDILLAI